jgi:hypothetical protein
MTIIYALGYSVFNFLWVYTERDFIIKVVCDAATQHIHSTIDL